jgi:hypothetical protein
MEGVFMRFVVSLLTAVCFIAAAEASTTSVATPQSQTAPSAPKPSTIDIIKQPSLRRQKLAQLHDHVSVDRQPAVLQHSLLLT